MATNVAVSVRRCDLAPCNTFGPVTNSPVTDESQLLRREIERQLVGDTMLARLMGLKTIAPGELNQLLRDAAPLTGIDVNDRSSWTQARVPGAANLDPADYAESDLPPDKNAMLVFYCSKPMCRKAPNAALRAKKIGYTNVQVMSAGIRGWLAAKLPTESGERVMAK